MLGLWHYRADRLESDHRGVMQGDPPAPRVFSESDGRQTDA